MISQLKLLAVLIALGTADFKIKLQLCSDAATESGIVKAAIGPAKSLHIKLGDNEEVPVDLNYFRETRLQVLETEMEGDLNSAEIVSFRYDNFDILCLEMLILEDENNELHIIQDYDPYAWDVNVGEQSWVSKTGRKISYWSDSCQPDGRILTQTAPFLKSCHDSVIFRLTPVDECATGLHDCGPLAICSDTLKSYECSCPFGFSGTGFKKIGLTGIDESCVRDANFEFTTTTFGDTTVTAGFTFDTSTSLTTTSSTTTTTLTTSTTTWTTTFTSTSFPLFFSTFFSSSSSTSNIFPTFTGLTDNNDISNVLESFQILLIPNLFENYGCSGSDGRLRTIKPIGKPSDEVDKAIRSRIHCIKCAQEFYNIRYSNYAFNKESRNCLNEIRTPRRTFCECDLKFSARIASVDTLDSNFDNSTCVTVESAGNPRSLQCCQAESGIFIRYNSRRFECCNGRLTTPGNC